MSFTYDLTLPTDLDWVRFRVMDTNPASYLLQDEQITALLAQVGYYQTLLEAINQLVLYYGQQPDKVGLGQGRNFSFDDRMKALMTLRVQILEELASETGPEAGVLGPRVPESALGLVEALGPADVLGLPPQVFGDGLPCPGNPPGMMPWDFRRPPFAY